jgi:hypothetical protein
MAQWLFDGRSTCNLADDRTYEIHVSGSPLTIIAPLGIDEHRLGLPEASDKESEALEDEVDDAEWDEESP